MEQQPPKQVFVLCAVVADVAAEVALEFYYSPSIRLIPSCHPVLYPNPIFNSISERHAEFELHIKKERANELHVKKCPPSIPIGGGRRRRRNDTHPGKE